MNVIYHFLNELVIFTAMVFYINIFITLLSYSWFSVGEDQREKLQELKKETQVAVDKVIQEIEEREEKVRPKQEWNHCCKKWIMNWTTWVVDWIAIYYVKCIVLYCGWPIIRILYRFNVWALCRTNLEFCRLVCCVLWWWRVYDVDFL